MNNPDADTRAHALPAPDRPGLWWFRSCSAEDWKCLDVTSTGAVSEVFPFHRLVDSYPTVKEVGQKLPGQWVFVAPPEASTE